MVVGGAGCRAPSVRLAPTTATSTPTVFTSQRSTFGPVTASNVRMLTSGQTPLAMK